MALLYFLAIGCTFAAGFVACLIWVAWRDDRRAREIDQLVRDAADADPVGGLGL